jgi:pimeloyl-ACP methyl ester carboxylesterase
MHSVALGIVAAATMFATAAIAQTRLVTEEMMVKSLDPGIEIYVRNKRPADITTFRSERTVLYVHGATYPASTAFDLQLGGMSWMDYIAARGYDVYLLDLRGYGKSARPKEMSEDPKTNPPIVRGDTAVKDIGTVVDFILARRNIQRLNLIGWSWGTVTMSTYSTQNPSKVERLILYAPGFWVETLPLPESIPPARIANARRLDNGQEVCSLARAWRNCLGSYRSAIDAGHCAVYRWEDAARPAACLARRHGWFLDEVKGPRNVEIEPDQLEVITAAFADVGVPSSQVVHAIENIIDADSGALHPMDEDW